MYHVFSAVFAYFLGIFYMIRRKRRSYSVILVIFTPYFRIICFGIMPYAIMREPVAGHTVFAYRDTDHAFIALQEVIYVSFMGKNLERQPYGKGHCDIASADGYPDSSDL